MRPFPLAEQADPVAVRVKRIYKGWTGRTHFDTTITPLVHMIESEVRGRTV